MNNNKDRKFTDIVGFHMEETTENSHSLTLEELTDDLRKKSTIAQDTIRTERKKYIIQLLLQNNINVNDLDIDSILDGNVPSWLLDLQKNVDKTKQDKTEKKIKYFKLTSGLILKLDLQNLTAYKFEPNSKEWIEDAGIFCEFEQGNLRGEFIDLYDIYPTRSPVENFVGKRL